MGAQDLTECILHFECYLLMATSYQVDNMLGNTRNVENVAKTTLQDSYYNSYFS